MPENGGQKPGMPGAEGCHGTSRGLARGNPGSSASLSQFALYSLRHPNLGTLARALSPDAALLVVVGDGPTASSRLASDKIARTPESDV